MTTALPVAGARPVARRSGLWRHSPRDAWPVGLALAAGALLLGLVANHTRLPLGAAWMSVGLAVWWASNTVAHIHIHTPVFRARTLNRCVSMYLTALTGVPQSLWRARHLWHHAGEPGRWSWRGRFGVEPKVIMVEIGLVLTIWIAIAAASPIFLLAGYLPGYLGGLLLCGLHGVGEHHGRPLADDPGVSHYGRWYNRLWFNDGYHAEHHISPGSHWTELPKARGMSSNASSARYRISTVPPALRGIAGVARGDWAHVTGGVNQRLGDLLDRLEILALTRSGLQDWLVNAHLAAVQRILAVPGHPPVGRILVVGGGLFPRTVLVLARVFPHATIQVLDDRADHLDWARHALVRRASRDPAARTILDSGRLSFREGRFDAGKQAAVDLVVIPLGYRGDRDVIYRSPPAAAVWVHDWVWRRRGANGTIVSVRLLKRLNLVLAETAPGTT